MPHEDTSQSPDGRSSIVKIDQDQRLVYGWAYLTHDAEGNLIRDRQGDAISDPSELEKAAHRFVEEERVAGAMHDRDGSAPRQVGKMVESFVVTPDKMAGILGISKSAAPTGWWVGFKIEDDDAWEKVKSGDYGMFSVHGLGKRTPAEG
tara:strand:- start:4405 stop:4851 length:447 start_codon:yes stop_codon:yes gene_type:complete